MPTTSPSPAHPSSASSCSPAISPEHPSNPLRPTGFFQPTRHRHLACHRLDDGRWDLLAGSQDDLLELAVALGIRFNRLPNGIDFAHSYLIATIGPDGKVLHKWTNPKQGPEASVAAIRSVTNP